MYLLIGVFVLALTALFEIGCVPARMNPAQVAVPASPEVVQSHNRYLKEYVLIPGDQLEIGVRRSPEVSRLVTIRPDGKITLPIAGDVQAAGLAPHELSEELTKVLSKRLLDPEVTVIAAQVRAPVVYVTGEVTNNGAVPLRNASNAIDAINQAGGFRRSAATREISVVRLGEDGFIRAIPIPVPTREQPAALLAGVRFQLQPDDIVFVPESGRSQFSRALDDFVTRPIVGINSVIGTYLNFRFVQALAK